MPFPLAAIIGLAAEFVPGLIRDLAGDDAGKVAEKIGTVAQTLTGKDNPDEAAEALRADPALALQFKKEMAALQVEREKIAAADRDSARRMQIETKSVMPALLAILIVVLFAAELALVFFGFMPEGDAAKTVVIKGLSLLELAFSLMLGFYYGTSMSSQRKDALLAGK